MASNGISGRLIKSNVYRLLQPKRMQAKKQVNQNERPLKVLEPLNVDITCSQSKSYRKKTTV